MRLKYKMVVGLYSFPDFKKIGNSTFDAVGYNILDVLHDATTKYYELLEKYNCIFGTVDVIDLDGCGNTYVDATTSSGVRDMIRALIDIEQFDATCSFKTALRHIN